ncbi:RimK family protein [Amorphus orientalis]|uniref:Glutathione synthase/RimK-type ligase-like ATP-grasp enzyme n=1 Tax=Amorphus orientalis TaxID=649198 RepID=A0AAE4ATI9_9HYPH|nr:RimK family protein [Amorphus orientalis]MDQ0316215.1 glutathione synthase/RimK-type ligase-like ATP-grasp enzyme [Amorphus orientalis]
MSDWVILVDQYRDFDQADTIHKVLSVRDYVARPEIFEGRRPILINLARSFAYQSMGYYASLLAEARGQRVLPSVQTIIELSRKALYRAGLPELEDALNRDWKRVSEGHQRPFKLLVAFGLPDISGFERFAALLFDWYRAPLIEVTVGGEAWATVERLRTPSIHTLSGERRAFVAASLARHTRRRWRMPKARRPARYTLAVLHDPREALPPSSRRSLEQLAAVGEKMRFAVEPIQKSDLTRLAEYDALFIRETTSIGNHTYRFARRAEQEGMPVIDDTVSMIRCTNKIYLKELLEAHRVPMPASRVVSRLSDARRLGESLGLPLVLKVPDGSFSRGVHKVHTQEELERLSASLLGQTDLLLAQEYLPTSFDWRVGVLGGKALFACQYLMAKNHWQIIKHEDGKPAREGGFRTFPVDNAPAEVIDLALRAAAPIGDGLYGVDIKVGPAGPVVIEINDNPNLDTDVEGQVLRDELWRAVIDWFRSRLEAGR